MTEVHARRHVLARQIRQMIEQFEAETGAFVHGIEIERTPSNEQYRNLRWLVVTVKV